jgi:hypothetical protein
VTKVQPKKSVLSRYSIALENSDSKRIQESKPALPVRTTSSLAERAAIFSTVQQPEATAVVSKRKSASVLKFPSKQEGSNSDEDSSSISPSVCVSHRFGQSPQVIKRRSIMLEDQVATTGLKKDIVGALKIHPSLNIKPNNDVACVKERNLQNKQEVYFISFWFCRRGPHTNSFDSSGIYPVLQLKSNPRPSSGLRASNKIS